jgi:hypothetical protein
MLSHMGDAVGVGGEVSRSNNARMSREWIETSDISVTGSRFGRLVFRVTWWDFA